jgi:hypothetical protein
MNGPGQPLSVDLAYLAQRERARPKGIARLVDGRFGLDRILAANAASPQAMEAIRQERRQLRAAAHEAEHRRVREAHS